MAKTFASHGDTTEKLETIEDLGGGAYALTAEGDPNVGAVEGEDFLVCFDARATPLMARRWLDKLSTRTDKPVRSLVLSHYHAVRVLGASAFGAEEVLSSGETKRLIDVSGQADWDVEFDRMPRLFEGHEEIPGLSHPTTVFDTEHSIELGGDRGALELQFLGRGHTSGDVVAWLPEQRVLFAGDLVENGSAVYTGEAYHVDWLDSLQKVRELGAEMLVGGRGEVARGAEAVERALRLTHDFIDQMYSIIQQVKDRRGSKREAYRAAREALLPVYGTMPVFEHAMVFDTQRVWDELDGLEPVVWTPQRDHAVWDELTAED